MPNDTSYDFDPLAQNNDNIITGEEHQLQSINGHNYYIIVPRKAPFFLNSVNLYQETENGNQPVEFEPIFHFAGASRSTGLAIHGGLIIKDLSITGKVILGYHTLGGDWVADDAEILSKIARRVYEPRQVYWDQIQNKQELFPPIDHPFSFEDLEGHEGILTELARLADGISENNPSIVVERILAGYGTFDPDAAAQSFQDWFNTNVGDFDNDGDIDPEDVAKWILATNSNGVAPVVSNATLSLIEGTTGAVNIEPLITDPDSDEFTITITSPEPSFGAATVNNGVISYQANSGYNGPDSIHYVVTDNIGKSGPGTIDIIVEPLPPAPVITILGEETLSLLEGSHTHAYLFVQVNRLHHSGDAGNEDGMAIAKVHVLDSDGNNVLLNVPNFKVSTNTLPDNTDTFDAGLATGYVDKPAFSALTGYWFEVPPETRVTDVELTMASANTTNSSSPIPFPTSIAVFYEESDSNFTTYMSAKESSGNISSMEELGSVTGLALNYNEVALLDFDGKTFHSSIYADAGATAIDSDGNFLTVTTSGDLVDKTFPGNYTITYDATDQYNTPAIQGTRFVTVRSDSAPVINIIGDDPLAIVEEHGLPEYRSTSGSTDISTFDLHELLILKAVGIVATGSPEDFDVQLPLVPDEIPTVGNSVNYTVRLVRKSNGSLTGSTNVAVVATGNIQSPDYIDAGASASDAQDGDITSSIVSADDVDLTVPGVYTVTYKVKDNDGNFTNKKKVVTVLPDDAPEITLLGSSNVNVFVNYNTQQSLDYDDPGATAYDAIDGDLTTSIEVSGTVDRDVLGSTDLTYSVTDSFGTTTSLVRTVNVVTNPDQPIEISVPTVLSLFTYSGSMEAFLPRFFNTNGITIEWEQIQGNPVTYTTPIDELELAFTTADLETKGFRVTVNKGLPNEVIGEGYVYHFPLDKVQSNSDIYTGALSRNDSFNADLASLIINPGMISQLPGYPSEINQPDSSGIQRLPPSLPDTYTEYNVAGIPDTIANSVSRTAIQKWVTDHWEDIYSASGFFDKISGIENNGDTIRIVYYSYYYGRSEEIVLGPIDQNDNNTSGGISENISVLSDMYIGATSLNYLLQTYRAIEHEEDLSSSSDIYVGDVSMSYLLQSYRAIELEESMGPSSSETYIGETSLTYTLQTYSNVG